jgi:ADP-heptose:LPS heptosyltransferase
MKRVLVANPYGIGDVLFMTPLLKALKTQPGVERVDVLLGSRTEAVLRNNPNVDTIYFLEKDELNKLPVWRKLLKLLSFYQNLRKNRYDTFVDLSLTREYAFFAKYFLWIGRRIGFNYKNRGIFLNYKQDLKNGFSDKKVPEYYAELLGFLKVPAPEKLEIEFQVSQDAKKRVATRFRENGISENARIAAVSCGGGESWGRDAHFKQWPPRFFKELLERIHQASPLDAIIFLGSRKDTALNHQAARGLSIPFCHFAGELTLEETAAAFSLSSFALLNEGGLYHLASSQKTPVITLVGPVDEKVYGAIGKNQEILIFREDLECRPCYRAFRYNSACQHRSCLQELTPEEAFQKILKSGFLENLTPSSLRHPREGEDQRDSRLRGNDREMIVTL